MKIYTIFGESNIARRKYNQIYKKINIRLTEEKYNR